MKQILSIIFLILTTNSLFAQNTDLDYLSFSYQYQETTHGDIFKYNPPRPAEFLIFDFDIKVVNFDSLSQYIEFIIKINTIHENNRKGFEYLDQILGRNIKIEYYFEQEVEWVNSREFTNKGSKDYIKQVTGISRLKRKFQNLILNEFGLFDGMFLSHKKLNEGSAFFCDDLYDFKYEKTQENLTKDISNLTIVKKYNLKTVEEHFRTNLEDHFQKNIELNKKKQGDDFDPTLLYSHENLKKDQLSLVLENLDLAEDFIYQEFKTEAAIPFYSEVKYYNILNICKSRRLSLFYEVFIEETDH